MALSDASRRTRRATMALFWVQVAAFGIMLGAIFVPLLEALCLDILVLMGVNALLGLTLTIAALRARVARAFKGFLILTGASSLGLAAFTVLHNVFYGLATLASDWPILKGVLQVPEAAFSIVSLIVCPIGFVVGTAGVIVITFRARRQAQAG